MSDHEWIPYAEAHAAVNDHGYGWTRLSLALVGGQVRSRGRKAEDPDGEPVEIKRELWAEWIFDPERGWLIPRGSERRRAPVGFIEVRFLRSEIERLAEEYAPRADAPPGALAKSYFDEPRWPLDHALNWIACRTIEALLLKPDQLRSLRGQALLYKLGCDRLVCKNPAHELLTGLKAGKLKAIGPDHKELPTEFWDGKSFAYWTWPEIRLRREDMLREWPHVNALATAEGSQTAANSSQANVPDGSECPSPSALDSTRDLPEPPRSRTARLAERVAAELVQMFPDRPAMKVKELLAEVQSRPGFGTVSLRTVEAAIPLAWPRGPHRTA